MSQLSLKEHGITVEDVRRNLPASKLYEEAIRHEPDARLANSGALVAYSGLKTGRSPKDKRIVRRPGTEGEVWWGPVNFPLEPNSFEINRERAKDYLNTRPRLYVVDGFAGWDPEHRVKVRVISSRPYHALFMQVMLIRPTPEELAAFGSPDYVIYNAGQFPANRHTAGMTSKTSVDISVEDGEVVILGTEYAGEMKKERLRYYHLNYLMPAKGVLSMHCSATADPLTNQFVNVLFGLSEDRQDLPSPPTPGPHSSSAMTNTCWGDAGIFQHRRRLLRQDDRPDQRE